MNRIEFRSAATLFNLACSADTSLEDTLKVLNESLSELEEAIEKSECDKQIARLNYTALQLSYAIANLQRRIEKQNGSSKVPKNKRK